MADCSSRKTILVLLYRFSEVHDSILGYKLCQKLVREDHDLLVTSTALGEELKKEKEDAERITEQFKGSIKIVSPEYEECEEPSFEWIAKFHKTYFGCLSELENVHCIIGLLPGTTKTAVDLKNKFKCKLILLATAKIGTDKQDLKAEINKLSENADEVWSVGTDLFTHFNSIFREYSTELPKKHKDLMLIPDDYSNEIPATDQGSPGIRTLVSLWNPGTPFIYKGIRDQSAGSSQQNFETVAAALGEINEEHLFRHKPIIEWHVHGLKQHDSIIESIKSQGQGDLTKLVALHKPKRLCDIKLNNCLVFIAPDIDEDTFNFAALSAMWQGIPTLVSSQSSIGKWLLQMECPMIEKVVVPLTGDSDNDKETWRNRIRQDVLNEKENPTEWAAKLMEFLRNINNEFVFDILRPPVDEITERGQKIRENASSNRTSAVEIVRRTAIRPSASFPGTTGLTDVSYKTRQELSAGPFIGYLPAAHLPLEPQTKYVYNEFCEEHKELPFNLFCENCDVPACLHCSIKYHNSHKLLTLELKGEKMKAVLNDAMETSKIVSKKVRSLEEEIHKIENTTLSAKQQMQHQHQNITNQLTYALNKQTNVLDDKKRKRITELNKEISKGRKIIQRMKNKEHEMKNLLIQISSSCSFVTQSRDMLKKLDFLEFEPDISYFTWKYPAYKPPLGAPAIDTDEFLTHCEKHFLGYFTEEGDETEALATDTIPAHDFEDFSYVRDFQKLSQAPTVPTERSRISTATAESVTDVSGSLNSALRQTTEGSFLSHNSEPENVIDNQTSVTDDTAIEKRVSAKLISYIDKKNFDTGHLNTFSDATFVDLYTWICGSSSNKLFKKDTVLFNITEPDFTVLLKKKQRDDKVKLPTLMTSHKEHILFAKKGGNQILSFNTQSHAFKQLYRDNNLAVAAICCSTSFVYLLNHNIPGFIQVCDSQFQTEGYIPSCVDDVKNCDFDMDLAPSSQKPGNILAGLDRNIVLCKSGHGGFVQKVNRRDGKVWRMDNSTHPKLTKGFNPCSIAVSASGDIFIADRGTNKIHVVSPDGRNVSILLGKNDLIIHPTRVCVHRDGKRLIVINNRGTELRNYEVEANQFSQCEDTLIRKSSAGLVVNQSAHSTPTLRRPCAEQDDDRPELTDTMLVDLSTFIVNLADLRKVAINGLDMKGHKVEIHINHYLSDITGAAYNLLREWRDTQPDYRTAYTKLSKALDKAEKPLFKKALGKDKL